MKKRAEKPQKKQSTRARIYMDFAAATPVLSEAMKEVLRVSEHYANPGAPHTDGLAARAILDGARARIASICAVKPQEIIFTSGATEANNSVLFGTVRARMLQGKRPHVVVAAIEHSSVLEVCRSEEMKTYADVTEVVPDEDGCIRPHVILAALRPETVLVSVGWANGEIGTIQPLRAISQVIRAYEKEIHSSIVFHTDAGQAPWAVSPQPHGVGVDCAVFSSTKLYGPRGVAALFVRSDVSLNPLLYGGTQERGLRAGTEDPALAVGFAVAFEALEKKRKKEYMRLQELRTHFVRGMHAALPGVVVNGTSKDQLPHIVNVSIPQIDSEYIMYALDHKGISLSTKSICLLEKGDPVSPVVKLLGGESWRATNTLRFSLGSSTTAAQVTYVLKALTEVVTQYKNQHSL